MSSTLLIGLNQIGVTGRLWSSAFMTSVDGRKRAPDSFDESIGYPGVWDVRGTTPNELGMGFQGTPAGRTRVWFRAPGYQDQCFDCVMPDDGAKEIRLEPMGMEQGQLRVRGRDFVDEQDRPWLFAGYTAHLLPSLVKKGQDIRPLFQEARNYGANTVIPICCHLSPWKREHDFLVDPFEPGWQNWLSIMCEIAAQERMRLAPAILADVQGYSTSQQQRIIDMASEVFRGRWNVIARKGNESNVNGWDPERLHFPDLGGVLSSHGSQGQDGQGSIRPYRPFLHFTEYELRRDWHKWMVDAGGGMVELHEGFEGWSKVDVPILSIEPSFFHDSPQDKWGDHRETDPVRALKLGVNTSANCAGGGFGASDGLECIPLQPRAADCARAYFRGLWAGFVR
jgi:hypothetical protein